MKADEVGAALLEARSVVIVPGYGMAVSRAQATVKELTTILLREGHQRPLRAFTPSRAACPAT